ncbi:MAG: DUF2274 domain-containing protein [Burkholderia gladioli]
MARKPTSPTYLDLNPAKPPVKKTYQLEPEVADSIEQYIAMYADRNKQTVTDNDVVQAILKRFFASDATFKTWLKDKAKA